MGADYEGQEKGIEELRALPQEAREYLEHHVGNALQVISGSAELGTTDGIHEQVDHIMDDLMRAGLFPVRKL